MGVFVFDVSLKITLMVVVLSLFTGCQQAMLFKQKRSVEITFEEPVRARFSGKGAGAGMMMMSSMGPMGIAIGVAIDEGIGKDIQASMDAEGISVESLIESVFLESSEFCEAPMPLNLRIRVERYGFILVPGENDPTSGQLHLNIGPADIEGSEADSMMRSYRFPEDFSELALQTSSLETLKVRGEEAANLLNFATRSIVKEYCMSFKET